MTIQRDILGDKHPDTFILIDTAKENTIHPNIHASQHANRYIDKCKRTIQGASLNNRRTKMECILYDRHVIHIAIRQYKTIVVYMFDF